MALLPILRRWNALSRSQRSLFWEAAVLPLLIGAACRIIGVVQTQRLLRHWAKVRSTTVAGELDALRFARSVVLMQQAIHRRLAIRGTCLVRALTLWSILLKRGVPTDLRLGYRRKNQAIEGHAWIEFEGIPLNETPLEVASYVSHSQPVAFDAFL